jgi:hypothetical protein
MTKKEIRKKLKDEYYYGFNEPVIRKRIDNLTDWIYHNFVDMKSIKKSKGTDFYDGLILGGKNHSFLNKYTHKLLGKIDKLQEQLDSAEAQMSINDNHADELQKENEGLKGRVGRLGNSNEVLWKKNDKLNNDNYELKKENKELYEQNKALNKKNEGLEETQKYMIHSHKEQIGDLKKKIDMLNHMEIPCDHHLQTPLEWLKEMAEKYPDFKEGLSEGVSDSTSTYVNDIIKSLDHILDETEIEGDILDFFGGDELEKWLDSLSEDEEECDHAWHWGYKGEGNQDKSRWFCVKCKIDKPKQECDHECDPYCKICGEKYYE